MHHQPLRAATAGPAPKPEVARHPVPARNLVECLASGIFLGSTAVPPTKHQSRHEPALSCDWPGDWQTDKRSAASPHRTPQSPWPMRSRYPVVTRLEGVRRPPQKKPLYVSSFGVDVYSGFQQKIPNFVDLRAGLQRPIHSYWQSAGPADIFINQGVSNEVQLLQRRPDRYFSDQE